VLRSDVPNSTTLLQFLREDLKLTHKMAAQGGAARRRQRATSTRARRSRFSTREVLTIEGLARTCAASYPAAFIEHSGFQCGFCTWQIMTTKVMLDRTANPPRTRRGRAERNLCRCSAYKKILESVMGHRA